MPEVAFLKAGKLAYVQRYLEAHAQCQRESRVGYSGIPLASIFSLFFYSEPALKVTQSTQLSPFTKMESSLFFSFSQAVASFPDTVMIKLPTIQQNSPRKHSSITCFERKYFLNPSHPIVGTDEVLEDTK